MQAHNCLFDYTFEILGSRHTFPLRLFAQTRAPITSDTLNRHRTTDQPGLKISGLRAGSILPDLSLLTLADKLHITAFSFIFMSLLKSTVSLHIFETGKESLSRRMDRRAWWVLLPIYLLISAAVTYFGKLRILLAIELK